jgi:hypothetical protein
MTATLHTRVEALESQRGTDKPAAQMTDRELLAIVAPDYTGPMPSDAELPALIHAWLMKPAPAEPPPADGLSAQDRYMRMLNGPANGGAHGKA